MNTVSLVASKGDWSMWRKDSRGSMFRWSISHSGDCRIREFRTKRDAFRAWNKISV